MKPLSKQHQKFINLVAGGETFERAYETICNKKATSSNKRVQGSRLAKRYALEIALEHEKLQKAISSQYETEAAKSALKSILSKTDRMELLSKMVKGEIKAKVPFVIGGKIMEYSQEPNHSDRVKAIAELNKMDGSYEVTKTDITSGGDKIMSINVTVNDNEAGKAVDGIRKIKK